MDESEVEVQVKDIALDPNLNTPIVVLVSKDGLAALPIWIGAFEANAIALCLEGSLPARPMTHDLFVSTLEILGVKIARVVITDLIEGTYVSLLHVLYGGRQFSIDSRPSDGIAIALRAGVPVFVQRQVFDKAALQQGDTTGQPATAPPDEDEEETPSEKPEWRM